MPGKHRASAVCPGRLGKVWVPLADWEFSGERTRRSVQTLPSSGQGDGQCSQDPPCPSCQPPGTSPCLKVVERELKNPFPDKKPGLPRTPLSPLAFEMYASLKAEMAWPQSPFPKQRSKLMSENLRERWSWSHALWVQILPLYVLPV